LQLRTAAMALLRHGSTMPLKRCEELMQVMTSFLYFWLNMDYLTVSGADIVTSTY